MIYSHPPPEGNHSELDDFSSDPSNHLIPSPESCNIRGSLVKLDGKRLLAPGNRLVKFLKKGQFFPSSIKKHSNLSTIHDLPPEILSELFKFYCMDSSLPPIQAALILGKVCQYWWNATTGTPQLWSSVVICADADDSCCYDVAEKWLSRSGALPLSLHISLTHDRSIAPSEYSPVFDLIELLRSHSARWKNLTVDELCEPAFLQPLFNNLKDAPSDFRKLNISASAIPQGQECTIDIGSLLFPTELKAIGSCTQGLPVAWDRLTHLNMVNFLSLPEILHIIGHAPKLVSCSITWGDRVYFDVDEFPDPVTSRSITHLHTGSSLVGWQNLLNFLTLPSLDILHYEYHSDSTNDPDFDILSAFLDHSSPRLTDLVLSIKPTISCQDINLWSDESIEITSLELDLSLMQTSMSTTWSFEQTTGNFLSLLASALDSKELPTLRTLVLNCPPSPETFFETWSALCDIFQRADQRGYGSFPYPAIDPEAMITMPIPPGRDLLKEIVINTSWKGHEVPKVCMDQLVFSRLKEIEKYGVGINFRDGCATCPVSRVVNLFHGYHGAFWG